MEKTYTKEELFDEIVRVMGDLFEVEPKASPAKAASSRTSTLTASTPST